MRPGAAVLLLALGACSAPSSPRPELQVERAKDPAAERSLDEHLWNAKQPRGEVWGMEKIWFVVPSPEPEFKKADCGLYANPIP